MRKKLKQLICHIQFQNCARSIRFESSRPIFFYNVHTWITHLKLNVVDRFSNHSNVARDLHFRRTEFRIADTLKEKRATGIPSVTIIFIHNPLILYCSPCFLRIFNSLNRNFTYDLCNLFCHIRGVPLVRIKRRIRLRERCRRLPTRDLNA